MIYVVKGTVTEYASTCAVPIVHIPLMSLDHERAGRPRSK